MKYEVSLSVIPENRMRPKAYTRRKELLWLNDLRWYFIQGLDPMVNIQDFFDAPHVQSSWKITRKDLNLVRFGLMWRIFDRSSSSSFLVGNSFSLTHFLITNFSSPGGLASLCKSFVLPYCRTVEVVDLLVTFQFGYSEFYH
jgi:hypothetical protein